MAEGATPTQHGAGPDAAGRPMLAVAGLHVRLGALEILRGVSLEVPARGVVSVLGANGVGKTTLLRTLSGIYAPSAGSVLLDGAEIGGLPSHVVVARGLAQAPEGRQIFGAMTIAENLQLGGLRLAKPEFEAELERVLRLFPLLRDRFRQKAGSLSGGEQQILCIGRALMARPRVLLLDEPSLGLAPRLVGQIFELIRAIRDSGLPVLLVEQNARAALACADTAHVMEGGRVVLSGPAAELAEDPRVAEVYLGGHA